MAHTQLSPEPNNHITRQRGTDHLEAINIVI